MDTLYRNGMDEKKAIIFTFTYGDNYGQRLQNFAVQYHLKIRGIEAYTAFQKPPIRYYKRKITKWLKGRENINIKRRKNFQSFDTKYISFTSVHNAVKNINNFDYYVTGSDQVWSPLSEDVNEMMFLTFAPKEKRVTFAPSIGVDSIPVDQIERYREYFEGFNSISVREDSARDIVKRICNKNAVVLSDPTIGIDSEIWESMAKEPETIPYSKYMLYYHLGSDTHQEIVTRIAKNGGMEIVDILNNEQYFSTGPSEFLWLVKNAEIVVTDSYHGTIFSGLFHVPCYVCTRTGDEINMNSRFKTLFRKYPSLEHYLDEKTMDKRFDYTQFEIEREMEKKLTGQYLDSVLL